MLTWDEALSRILARTSVLERQHVRLEAAAGRVLAEPLMARNDSPPFDLSAVDGFGVHAADVVSASPRHPIRLRLAETIHAGGVGKTRFQRGTVIKILTGACVPRGVEAIVMKEDCQEESTTVAVHRRVKPGENVRPRGGEFRKGEKVLPTGVRITPPVIGLLATFGYARVSVHKRPAVTLVVTGDELLSPSRELEPGKIRDANSYALAAAIRATGIDKCRRIRLKDRPALLEKRLADAMKRSDVVVAVGGMSVGDRDFIRPILGKLGVEEKFWRVAIKPGKPAFFGLASHRGRGRPCLVFGLPGNPVSALVCFHQLVKPALSKMMGLLSATRLSLPARLIGERRKQPGRLEWLRGTLTCQDGDVRVEPTSGQDSHMLGGLARANCLIHFPQAADHLADDEEVIVEPLSWHE